jgi:hypothetical protein
MRTALWPWQALPNADRPRVWLVVVGFFLIMALLLSFHQVVKGAVKQSAEWHQTTARFVSASRACNALPSPVASARCSQQLSASSVNPVTRTAFFTGF